MKLSPPTRYAIRLLFELYLAQRPLSISTLSRMTGISLRAVENVHTELKARGITRATVGAKGGISLRRSLSEISLGQLVSWFDGGVAFSVCCGEKANECPNRNTCHTRSIWHGVSDHIQGALDKLSLDDILGGYRSGNRHVA